MVPEMTINSLTLVTRNNFGLRTIFGEIQCSGCALERWLWTYLEGPRSKAFFLDGAMVGALFFQLASKQQQNASNGLYW
jgi:hypothetical protein